MPWIKSRQLSSEDVYALDSIPPELHCACETNTPLTLTTTPQIVDNFNVNTISPSVGVTESGGVFTIGVTAGVQLIIERTYRNSDRAPTDEVIVTITIKENDIDLFTSSLPIPPAVLNRGDGILSVTDPFMIPVSAGSTFEIYVSASDDGANPAGTTLARCRLTSHSVYAL